MLRLILALVCGFCMAAGGLSAGGYIYYESSGEIYRIRPDGTGQELIKTHPTYKYARPKASKQYQLLFVDRWESSNNTYPNYTGLVGGDDFKLSTNKGCGGHVVPSPLTGYVFYTWNTGVCPNQQISKVNLDGTGDTVIIASGYHDRLYDVSADGRIVYGVIPPGGEYGGNIYEADEDGGNAVKLTTSGGAYHAATYSPDMTRIAYGQAYSSGRGDLFIMNRDGSGVINVTNAGNSEVPGISWSPGGEKLAYAWSVDGKFQIFIMNADGTERIQVTQMPTQAINPSWVSLADEGNQYRHRHRVREGTVSGEPEKHKMAIAPNKLDIGGEQGTIRIQLNGNPGETATVKIFDSAGRSMGSIAVMLDGNGMGVASLGGEGIDGRRLSPGVYFAVTEGGGTSDRKKFIVTAEAGR